MARSVLLQLARDSITEVIEAKRLINKNALLSEYPLLAQSVATGVNIYLNGELRGSAHSDATEKSLLEDLVCNAKKAAFDNPQYPPITTSEYIESEVEVVLYTPEGEMRERDPSLFTTNREKFSIHLE
ncbi:MAG: AMMECR1 domain-containing protein [Sulfurimonadaceae bacterium]